MRYAVAKQLIETGFPMEEMNIELGKETILNRTAIIIDIGEAYYVPDLSELIEACGKITLEPKEAGNWMAIGGLPERNGDIAFDKNGFGPTIEEAVANLWLALHET